MTEKKLYLYHQFLKENVSIHNRFFKRKLLICN